MEITEILSGFFTYGTSGNSRHVGKVRTADGYERYVVYNENTEDGFRIMTIKNSNTKDGSGFRRRWIKEYVGKAPKEISDEYFLLKGTKFVDSNQEAWTNAYPNI